jgi:intein/homing endonuclease
MSKTDKTNYVDFSSIFDKIMTEVKSQSDETYLPDIIKFCESPQYLNLPKQGIKLMPMQRVILKTFYRGQPGNEHLRLDPEELEMLRANNLHNVLEKYHSQEKFRELVLVLGRRCISGDTLIFDAKTGETKPVSEWNKLDVWTYNENTKQFEVHSAEVIEQGKRQCFRVTVANGDYVDCTDNHPFLTPLGWKELKCLQEGDLIAQADCLPKPDDGEGLEEHEAAILGYIIGDGNCTTSRAYFTCNDQKVIWHLQRCLDKLSDNMIVQYDNNRLSPYQYSLRQKTIKYKTVTDKIERQIGGRDTSDLFKFLGKHGLQGKTAKQKRVPEALFSASSRAKAAFLKAYFSCDGHFEEQTNKHSAKIEVYSVNRQLLDDVRLLLQTFGIESQIYKKTSTTKIKSKTCDRIYRYANHVSYRLQICQHKSIRIFTRNIGALKNYDIKRVSSSIRMQEDQLSYVPIKSINQVETKPTYDLCIAEQNCHNFITSNGLQMHNSGKDFMTALMACYEAMKLLELPGGDPFKYYGLDPGNPIYILTVAISADQARILFYQIKSAMMDSEYFRNKIGHTEADKIFLKTRADRQKEKELTKEGFTAAADRVKGSVVIMSGHSNSESLLGKRYYCLLLDEVASFKSTGGPTSGDRIYSALGPGTADFKRTIGIKDDGTPIKETDSKIISISSPRSEQGMLFRLYNETATTTGRLAFRLPTWKVNLLFTEDSLRVENKYMTPTEFAMEFGAEFSGTAGEKFIPDAYVDRAFEIGREAGLKSQTLVGIPGMVYYAHLDPAVTSHNYALVILHVENRIRMVPDPQTGQLRKERFKMFVIDHMKAWHPDANTAIKVADVDDYVIKMATRFRLGMVSYDAWNSVASIQKLKSKGIPTKMTPYRTQYKMFIYENLENLLIHGHLALPPHGDYAELLKNELKCLKRTYTYSGFRIGPDPEGQVKTDDLCVDPETIVFTTSDTCCIKDARPGQFVLTHTGNFREIINASIHSTDSNSYAIKPYYGFELKATANHPVETYEHGNRIWKNVECLAASDWVVRTWPAGEYTSTYDLADYVIEADSKHHNVDWCEKHKVRPQNPNSKWLNRHISTNSAFGYLSGIYLAEGNIANHGIAFAANIEDLTVHQRIHDSCKEVFGIEPSAPRQGDGKGCQLTVDSTLARDFVIDVFGHRNALSKTIPTTFLTADKTFQKSLLIGMFDGDGCFDAKSITFTTTSQKLAMNMQIILLRFGIVSSISISKRVGKTCIIMTREAKCNADLINVRITDAQSYNKLATILDIPHRKAKSKFHTPRYEFIDENSIACKIRSIREIDMRQVCNLTVADDSSFVAGSINTHNCDALAGACGTAIEGTISGYPRAATVFMPQAPGQSSAVWNIGRGQFTDAQFNQLRHRFGFGA